MYKEVDYKSIVSNLNEFLDNVGLQDRFTFNYETCGWMNRICFEHEVMWSDDIDPTNDEVDCDWTTETLLEHCKEQFRQYVKLLNTIKI